MSKTIDPNAQSGPSGDEGGPRRDTPGLPEAFVERLERILSQADLTAALRSFSRPKRTSFRINTLLSGADTVASDLLSRGIRCEPVPWMEGAFSVEENQREALLGSGPYLERRIYVQNAASMIPPVVLSPRAGEEVLDLAAAPGGKTHQMACEMKNSGRITAVEAVRSRYYKLRDNMQSLGAEVVRPFFQDGTTTWRHRPEYFDRVLLDAPCSSEGRFRADDAETTKYWSVKKVREASRKQRRLLFSAIQCLKPGGRLVYSTCSFAPEENEMVIHKLLQKFPDVLRVVPPEIDIPAFREGLAGWDGREISSQLRHARRIVPDDLCDGFFVCCLEKMGSTVA